MITGLSSCAASTEGLELAVSDKPGVLSVQAQEASGDDMLPFMHIPKFVTVHMSRDATTDQVMAVFDAYDDDIDDDDVAGIDVILAGTKQATLSTGEDVHATHRMAEDLIEAQNNTHVTEYVREAYPAMPGVKVTLASTDFAHLAAAAGRYRNDDDVQVIDISSAHFSLHQDKDEDDARLIGARERLAHRVASQFHLHGASVSDGGPLELIVSKADVAAVRRLVDETPGAKLAGDIRVGTSPRGL